MIHSDQAWGGFNSLYIESQDSTSAKEKEMAIEQIEDLFDDKYKQGELKHRVYDIASEIFYNGSYGRSVSERVHEMEHQLDDQLH